jgi:hypothetical protein
LRELLFAHAAGVVGVECRIERISRLGGSTGRGNGRLQLALGERTGSVGVDLAKQRLRKPGWRGGRAVRRVDQRGKGIVSGVAVSRLAIRMMMRSQLRKRLRKLLLADAAGIIGIEQGI